MYRHVTAPAMVPSVRYTTPSRSSKVLVVSVAAWLILRTRSRPSWHRSAAMAACTAAAFLFRHDYAVYCGVAFAAALVADAATWRDRWTRTVAFGALTLGLLTPSLGWVQAHAGVVPYLPLQGLNTPAPQAPQGGAAR